VNKVNERIGWGGVWPSAVPRGAALVDRKGEAREADWKEASEPNGEAVRPLAFTPVVCVTPIRVSGANEDM